jgi:hypothetical protein
VTSDRWQTRLMEAREPRVVVPYTESMHPLVTQLLQRYGIKADYQRVDGDDGYRLLMQQLWKDGQTVIVIEHDIIPWPGAIEELLLCQCHWGTYSYHINGGVGVSHMLGCAKLTAEVMEALPNVWSEWTHWSMVDRKLFFAAQGIGLEPHLHRPAVIHLRDLGNARS